MIHNISMKSLKHQRFLTKGEVVSQPTKTTKFNRSLHGGDYNEKNDGLGEQCLGHFAKFLEEFRIFY